MAKDAKKLDFYTFSAIRYQDKSNKHADMCLSCLHSSITLFDFFLCTRCTAVVRSNRGTRCFLGEQA